MIKQKKREKKKEIKKMKKLPTGSSLFIKIVKPNPVSLVIL
jgi:hypothetical protein